MELSLLRQNYLFPEEKDFQHHECCFPKKSLIRNQETKTSHRVM